MTRITQYVSLGIGMWVVGSSGLICGCSSNSNSNPSNGNPITFSPSVDGSKQLGALTTAETQQLCRDTLTYEASHKATTNVDYRLRDYWRMGGRNGRWY